MASDPVTSNWSKRLRGGHVRLRFLDKDTVQASLHGELMDVAGVLVRARVRASSLGAALRKLYDTIRGAILVPEVPGSDAELEK